MIANSCTNVQGIVVVIPCKYGTITIGSCTNVPTTIVIICCQYVWPWVLHWCCSKQHGYMHNSRIGHPMGHFVELLLDWTFLPPFGSKSCGCPLPPP
jgi:hypothetical protein